MDNPQPRVGVACFVRKGDSFLMIRRAGSHGDGTWSVPGGHLEQGESWEKTAKREVEEETGLIIDNPTFIAITNDIFSADKHYVTIWMEADYIRGEPQITEPDKTPEFAWKTIKNLPDNLFEPCWTNLRKSLPYLFA